MNRDLYFFAGSPCYVVRWRGRVSPACIGEHWADLQTRPEWNPALSSLHDLRGISAVRTLEEVFETGDSYASVGVAGEGRAAFLVDNPGMFGLCRQLASISGLDEQSLVTYELPTALDWVGLPPGSELPY